MAATFRGVTRSRVPVGPLAVHYCARLAGHSLRQYSTHARLLAESVVRYYEVFRPDAVWVSADTWVSAQAMGAAVGATGEDQPLGGLGVPHIRTGADIDRLSPVDVGTQGRYPLMLEAVARVVEAVGQDTWVVACFDQYPFSLAAALMGLSQIMLRAVEDRAMVEALMERCLEHGAAYAVALAQAGADLLSGGDSPAGLLGPKLYRELALPFEQRLIRRVKSATAKPISLHVCGQATPILADMATAGADVIEIDQDVDLAEACRIVGPSLVLWGNLDPVGTLAQGTPQAVRQAALQAMEAARTSRHERFVLSSGCTLAMETPEQNLRALFQAARSF
jgi:MtaA/CmuA family methyltransferase